VVKKVHKDLVDLQGLLELLASRDCRDSSDRPVSPVQQVRRASRALLDRQVPLVQSDRREQWGRKVQLVQPALQVLQASPDFREFKDSPEFLAVRV